MMQPTNYTLVSKSFYSSYMFCNHLVCFLLFFYGGTNSNILFSMCLFLSYLALFIWTFCLLWKNLAFFFVLGMLEQIHFICMMNMPYLHKQEWWVEIAFAKNVHWLEKVNSRLTFGLLICKLWIKSKSHGYFFRAEIYRTKKLQPYWQQNKIQSETV